MGGGGSCCQWRPGCPSLVTGQSSVLSFPVDPPGFPVEHPGSQLHCRARTGSSCRSGARGPIAQGWDRLLQGFRLRGSTLPPSLSNQA